MKKTLLTLLITFVVALAITNSHHLAYAHEAYVLTGAEFREGLMVNSKNPFAPLMDPSHIKDSIVITAGVITLFLLVFLWSLTPASAYLDKLVKKLSVVGPLLIRISIAIAFFYSAQSNSIFGPELSLAQIPGGQFIRFLLFFISFLFLLGLFVQLASLVALAIFIYMTHYYGTYMVTYLNYLGELIVLLFFGSKFLSLDWACFKKIPWFNNLEKYRKLEIPIVRILYGIALAYAGYNIKFQHQELTVWVYNEYHLKNFFKASAEFIAAGAGLSEITIGLFIILGFMMRLTVLISLVFITLSLLYFRELIWPHLMLYGISFSLLINAADPLTLDRYLGGWVKTVFNRAFNRK